MEVDFGIRPRLRTMGRRRALTVDISTSLPSPLLLCAAFAVAMSIRPALLLASKSGPALGPARASSRVSVGMGEWGIRPCAEAGLRW